MTIGQFRKKIQESRSMLKADLLSFHRDAAMMARDEREKAFMGSKAPDGSKWAPLKPATIRAKKGEHSTVRVYRAKKGGPSGLSSRKAKKSQYPEKPLIDTGMMMKPTVSAGIASGKVTMARSRGEVVSSAGSIGKIHNEGEGKNPKREHWAIYPNAVKRIEDLWEKKLDGIVSKLHG
jgi:hypothetical protein